MTIAYIAHPVGGNVEENLKDLCRIVRRINLEYPTIVPFVPYYCDIVAMNDDVPEERARGIKNDMEILGRKIPTEVWLTGNRISLGMQEEEKLARELGIPVYDYINKL